MLCYSFVNLTERHKGRVMCQQLIGDIKHTWAVSAFLRNKKPYKNKTKKNSNNNDETLHVFREVLKVLGFA